MKNLRTLTATLTSAVLDNIEVLLLDIDGAAWVKDVDQLRDKVTGSCEVAFIRDGEISEVVLHGNAAAFEAHLGLLCQRAAASPSD